MLFDNGIHKNIVFDDIIRQDIIKGKDIQANQFLIIHKDEGMIYEPGGTKLMQPLYNEVSKFISITRIKKFVISHQDPDTCAAINHWMLFTKATAFISQLWVRFIPHLCRNDFSHEFFVPVPDSGMRLDLNGAEIILIPAHFLHSPGNFQLYDPTSRILFSGDLGTSIYPSIQKFDKVINFNEHVRYMEGFHKRYIASEKASRLWSRMVRQLDIEAIVPQHGHRYFMGKEMVDRFIDWIGDLRCGIDLLDINNYMIPPK
ncbi:MAG: FprA family A-type flavoprotein [Nitrospirae bacterium]|nr:FprA family A-type flavoprotein [Nitrospirota bacterium]